MHKFMGLMMPFIAHYMNKYPGGEVDSDGESFLRAYDGKGKLRVALDNAAGSVRDKGKMVGALDAHDLSPIPKDCRVFCHSDEGVVRHKEADAREEVAAAVAKAYDGKVPSVEQMMGDAFNGSHKQVEEFRAQDWMEKGSVPAKKSKK